MPIQGLWTVQFHGPGGVGGGVVVITDRQLLGGDSAFLYKGTYNLSGDLLKARVTVKNFEPTIPSVLGISGTFDLVIEATVEGEEINGAASLAEYPDSKLIVRLKKDSSFL